MRGGAPQLGRSVSDADASQFGRVHAGQDGDGEEARGAGSGGGFGGGGHHGGSASGVKGQERGSGGGCGADCPGNGVGDVVELEIEEYVEAAVAEVLDEGVAGGVVEFHPYLEPLAGVAQRVDEVERLAGVGHVEGYDQAVFRVEGV